MEVDALSFSYLERAFFFCSEKSAVRVGDGELVLKKAYSLT
jgi:hypothetical protein